MSATKKRLGEILTEAGVIDATQLQAALGHQRQWGVRLGQALVDMKLAAEADIVQALSLKFGYDVARLDGVEAYAQEQALKLVPREFAVRNNVLPLAADTGTISVAMSDPTNLAVVDELRFRTGKRVKVCIGGDREIAGAVKAQYPGDERGVPEAIALDLDLDEGAADGVGVFDPFGGGSKDALEAFFGSGDTASFEAVPAPPPPAPPTRALQPTPAAARSPAPAAPAPRPAVAAPQPAAPAVRPAPPREGPTAISAPPTRSTPQPAPAPTTAARPAAPPHAPMRPGPNPAAAAPPATPPRPGSANVRPSQLAPAPQPALRAAPATPVAPSRAAPAALAASPSPTAFATHPEELTPFPPEGTLDPGGEAIPATDLPDEEMVEGRQAARPLSPHELQILEAIDRLAGGAHAEPDIVKPAQAMAAVIRLLIQKRLITELEFLDALQRK